MPGLLSSTTLASKDILQQVTGLTAFAACVLLTPRSAKLALQVFIESREVENANTAELIKTTAITIMIIMPDAWLYQFLNNFMLFFFSSRPPRLLPPLYHLE